ncbi:hypothetical protein Bbelb_350630 [Branchiostoma belcheri]|nr:hypothetical protein Bbelb_350630 [Branchiostoma belcheri]
MRMRESGDALQLLLDRVSTETVSADSLPTLASRRDRATLRVGALDNILQDNTSPLWAFITSPSDSHCSIHQHQQHQHHLDPDHLAAPEISEQEPGSPGTESTSSEDSVLELETEPTSEPELVDISQSPGQHPPVQRVRHTHPDHRRRSSTTANTGQPREDSEGMDMGLGLMTEDFVRRKHLSIDARNTTEIQSVLDNSNIESKHILDVYIGDKKANTNWKWQNIQLTRGVLVRCS